MPEFMRVRAAAASSGEMVEASTPPLSLSSSSKDSSVDLGCTYTILPAKERECMRVGVEKVRECAGQDGARARGAQKGERKGGRCC